jgi:hypothetical protein
MPCPFGYKAEPSDTEEREVVENTSDADAENSDTAMEVASDDKPNSKKIEVYFPLLAKVLVLISYGLTHLMYQGLNGDFEKDPVSWFYQNQIKSGKIFMPNPV